MWVVFFLCPFTLQASKELKHLRVLYSGESQCLQQAQAEVHALKSQQVQLLAEKSQLLQEVAALHRKVSQTVDLFSLNQNILTTLASQNFQSSQNGHKSLALSIFFYSD